MKISPLFLLVTDLAQAQGGLDYYNAYADDYEVYYDDLGNKKKKKKKKNKQNNNNYTPPQTNYAPAAPTYANANGNAASAWAPSNSWGSQAAKGTVWSASNSPLVGNGRFCWNCYARADSTGSAYYNCFNGAQQGFIEMCTGEEYFCMWNERRHQGQVTEVGGGCKSDHSCLNQMTANFIWEFDATAARITGDQCRAGANANNGVAYEDSVCTWCCDAMVNNRFNPVEADLCNFKDKASSPAGDFFANGSTDTFEWFSDTEQFANLYSDGQYHRLFMIAIQTAIGSGILVG